MSDESSREPRRGLPSDAPAPSPEADNRYAIPRFAVGRPRTIYSDTVPSTGTTPPKGHGAHRSHRSDHDRQFLTSLGLTAASTVIPGSGMLGAPLLRTKVLGGILTTAFLAVAGFLLFRVVPEWRSYIGLATSRGFLVMIMLAALLLGLLWVATIALTNLLTRPPGLRTAQRLIAAGLVTVLASMVAIPSALAARYSYDTIKALQIFDRSDNIIAESRPTIDVAAPDPWEGHPRLNILLLGADNDKNRDYNNTDLGIRTDTIMVASIDTATGKTTLIQIPRQVPYVPFPEESVLHEEFPDGYMRWWGGVEEAWINTLWMWSEQNSDFFPNATYPGAEGLKLGVEGTTGLDIDYFVMLDIDGLKELIDAMGGVTVNINQRLAIGGDTSGRPPVGYLEPGPEQHLNGYNAMWYARSRSNTDDYNRMARQSCLIGAVVDQANPVNLLTRFEAVAAAGSDMVQTDIPSEMLRPIVDLALRVQDQPLSRMAFTLGHNGYHYENSDFEAMREAVDQAINPPPKNPEPAPTQTATETAETTKTAEPEASEESSNDADLSEGAQDVADACAYHPVTEE